MDRFTQEMHNFITPCNKYSQVNFFEYDFLDQILQDLQEVFTPCQLSLADDCNTGTNSLYDDLFYSPNSKKQQPTTPQLELTRLDEFVLQELDIISAELSVHNSTRRGQRVKRRLFSCSGDDDEPAPKKRCTINLSHSESDDDSEFTWSSVCRI
ncbi:uncharacterized protein LOC134710454 [Mytilus trossulus]|uniref:uncharacterized protein LOC134710454 n=1 Tax=Mytilus trossulus TaxID=6551 RepID=UPI0030062E5F